VTAWKLPPAERSVRAFVAAMQAGGVTLHAMPDGSILGRRRNRDGQQEDVPPVWQAEIDKRRDEIRKLLNEFTETRKDTAK